MVMVMVRVRGRVVPIGQCTVDPQPYRWYFMQIKTYNPLLSLGTQILYAHFFQYRIMADGSK